MEAEKHMLDSIELENGLTVHFEDLSRVIAGDRCQVRLLIRVPLEVRPDYFEDYPDAEKAFREFKALLTDAPVEFRVEKVRNFIDLNEACNVLEQMRGDFIRSGLEYLKNRKFAANFIGKKYEELRQGRVLRRAWLGTKEP